jgi:hypothetical protein
LSSFYAASQQKILWALRMVAGEMKGRTPFLKKRSKKLLPMGIRGPIQNGPRAPTDKSFLVLFFKKELLPSC